MAVLRLARFRAGPAGTGKMLTGHAALAAAVEDACPGLIEVPLAAPVTRGRPPASPQPRHVIGRAPAARPGGEQA